MSSSSHFPAIYLHNAHFCNSNINFALAAFKRVPGSAHLSKSKNKIPPGRSSIKSDGGIWRYWTEQEGLSNTRHDTSVRICNLCNTMKLPMKLLIV